MHSYDHCVANKLSGAQILWASLLFYFKSEILIKHFKWKKIYKSVLCRPIEREPGETCDLMFSLYVKKRGRMSLLLILSSTWGSRARRRTSSAGGRCACISSTAAPAGATCRSRASAWAPRRRTATLSVSVIALQRWLGQYRQKAHAQRPAHISLTARLCALSSTNGR